MTGMSPSTLTQNPEYEAMDIDPLSDPDSSSSSSSSKSSYSSSSSSTHKSSLRRGVLELEGMLESTTEDLWAATESLGLNM